jgi:hypothetical protein
MSGHIVRRIHRLQGTERDQKPWLKAQLRNKEAAVRQAAALSLFHEFNAREVKPIFLEMLSTERDDDVVLALMNAVGMWSAGTKDRSVIAAIRAIQCRFDGASHAFQEAVEDALLRIAYGLDTRAIIQLENGERHRLVTAIV